MKVTERDIAEHISIFCEIAFKYGIQIAPPTREETIKFIQEYRRNNKEWLNIGRDLGKAFNNDLRNQTVAFLLEGNLKSK